MRHILCSSKHKKVKVTDMIILHILTLLAATIDVRNQTPQLREL